MTRRTLLALAALLVLTGATAAATRLLRSAPPPRPVANRAFDGVRGATAVVWALGDGAAGTKEAKALARAIAADDPARVLYLGDVYESGTPTDFRRRFRSVYGSLIGRMLPTPGNHEWPNHPEGYDRFWKEVTGAPTPPWYSVRLARWQLLSLNSEAPHGAGDEQVAWLDRQLRRTARCRLAIWHRPRYSAGSHGDQSDMEPLWSRLVGRATLVLNGHDHNVQRLKPERGTVELVQGAGGRGHYSVDRGYRRIAYADDKTYAAARIVLRPDRAQIETMDATGRVMDRATVPCVPAR